ncbi:MULTISPECIES: DUF7310 family coiled-coil domain-containing protein [Haloferacaceae]|uniref:DUF7310 domain-containing protein n=1 Tax=Halorubrum glutamatedens TaxID=2707018 RepID=A0ABD5QLI1_9EURY|nr:hypothetical protein [Halobellus captivus]
MANQTNASGSPRDRARLEERLDAVERALTGTDRTVAGVVDGAAADAEREAIADRLDAVEARIEELEAATQAVRGYAGAIRAVNREVERRADLALARATAARDGSSPALEPSTGNETRGNETRSDGDFGVHEVPNEEALDAAIPDDGRSTGDRSIASNVGALTSGTGNASRGESNGGSNGDGSEGKENPLERLREAL